jgi:hypothetical protein
VKKPRITIIPSDMVVFPFIFVVRFPGKGWKTRRCLTWNEALFAAGLVPEKRLYES